MDLDDPIALALAIAEALRGEGLPNSGCQVARLTH
jgi:hypothetical protein